MHSTLNIFECHTGKLIHKWDHYFEIYDRHFNKYIEKDVVVLEIGVSQGEQSNYGKNILVKSLFYKLFDY